MSLYTPDGTRWFKSEEKDIWFLRLELLLSQSGGTYSSVSALVSKILHTRLSLATHYIFTNMRKSKLSKCHKKHKKELVQNRSI